MIGTQTLHAIGRTGGPTPESAMSPAVHEIWAQCALREALGANADKLLADTRAEAFRPGDTVYDAAGTNKPPFVLVTKGLVRVYCTSPQGRQATIRYALAGDVVGLPFVLAPHLVACNDTLAVQALSVCEVLHLSPQTFRRVAEADPKSMWRLFGELAESMVAAERLLAQNVFQPVRARVARHMLQLAEPRGDRIVVAVSQQDVADAIGTVREVVSRVIVQLRDEGLIRREKGVYVILDTRRLQLVAEDE